MNDLIGLKARYEERRFRMNSAEKAAYALGFHAGMARATNRDPVLHRYDKSPRFPDGLNQSHCGCPICCFGCDACAEENMQQNLEDR